MGSSCFKTYLRLPEITSLPPARPLQLVSTWCLLLVFLAASQTPKFVGASQVLRDIKESEFLFLAANFFSTFLLSAISFASQGLLWQLLPKVVLQLPLVLRKMPLVSHEWNQCCSDHFLHLSCFLDPDTSWRPAPMSMSLIQGQDADFCCLCEDTLSPLSKCSLYTLLSFAYFAVLFPRRRARVSFCCRSTRRAPGEKEKGLSDSACDHRHKCFFCIKPSSWNYSWIYIAQNKYAF